MEGTYVPYTLDAWTGEATEMAEFHYEDGQTVIPVDLDYSNIALFVFEKVDEEQPSIVETDADSAYTAEDGIKIRATKTGTYTTTLSNGETKTSELTVPEEYDITNWDLTVDSWNGTKDSDGNFAGDLVRTETIDGLETTNRKTSTEITEIHTTLNTHLKRGIRLKKSVIPYRVLVITKQPLIGMLPVQPVLTLILVLFIRA
ncbi:MAG: hypothetical protein ACLU6Y_14295 [Ruminococcus sp.]